MTFLILHGITGNADNNWQPWLKNELVVRGHKAIVPTEPNPDHPDRKECLAFVQKLLENENKKQLVLVGHSLGVATLMDYLETIDTPIRALISLSGFDEDYGAELNSYFMGEKTIDTEKVKKNTQERFVLYGNDDPYVPQETLAHLAVKLDVKPQIIEKGGHLNARAGYLTFPRLLEICESLE